MNKITQDFSGKVVLITGAASGIGAGTAIYLSSLGANLSLVGRRQEDLQKTAENCQQTHKEQQKPFLIAADLDEDKDIEKIVEETVRHYGKLNVLVNNAATFGLDGIENSRNLEEYDKIFQTNLRAVYKLTNLTVPYLVSSKGNIVNVSSITALRAFPGVLSVCMAKSALDQFTRCTALELGPKGVRVNSVNPGTIATKFIKRAGLNDEEIDEYLKKMAKLHPLQRVGTPEDVAMVIAFLASNQAEFITGTNIPVDGGRHVACPQDYDSMQEK